MQNDVVDAIVFQEKATLFDLGAHDSFDINFTFKFQLPGKETHNNKSKFNVSPLMIAVATGNKEIVNLLLHNSGIQINL